MSIQPEHAPDLTRWWWVRHAPVPDGGLIYGQRDLDCDCTNRNVFTAVAQALPPGAVWMTSHLARTRQTAAAILAAVEHEDGASIRPVAVPALAEQHLGDWQGQERASFWAGRPSRHDHWFGPADERAPNGESFADLCARTSAAVLELTAAHRGRDIVAVTHGGTIRAALGLALGLDPDAALPFTIDNCSITRLDHLGGDPARRWKVVTVNHQPWSLGRLGGGVAA
jgi:broad specificity phosphatase PhoE